MREAAPYITAGILGVVVEWGWTLLAYTQRMKRHVIMSGRAFEDNPSIADDERLFRRIPRTWINWDDQGNASISSAAFKDEELSINIESIMVRDGRLPADAICEYSGYGLAEITAAHDRSLNQVVASDPIANEPAQWRRVR